jgi:hypothetical protein
LTSFLAVAAASSCFRCIHFGRRTACSFLGSRCSLGTSLSKSAPVCASPIATSNCSSGEGCATAPTAGLGCGVEFCGGACAGCGVAVVGLGSTGEAVKAGLRYGYSALAVQLNEDIELILHAVSLNGRHADSARHLLPILFLQDIFRLGTDGGDDMTRERHKRIDKAILLRRYNAPSGREFVSGATCRRHSVNLLERPALASPGVRQRVDDEHVVAGFGRRTDGLKVVVDREELELCCVELKLVGVLRSAAMLRVDERHPAAEVFRDEQRIERLPATGWTRQRHPELRFFLCCLLEHGAAPCRLRRFTRRHC